VFFPVILPLSPRTPLCEPFLLLFHVPLKSDQSFDSSLFFPEVGTSPFDFPLCLDLFFFPPPSFALFTANPVFPPPQSRCRSSGGSFPFFTFSACGRPQSITLPSFRTSILGRHSFPKLSFFPSPLGYFCLFLFCRNKLCCLFLSFFFAYILVKVPPGFFLHRVSSLLSSFFGGKRPLELTPDRFLLAVAPCLVVISPPILFLFFPWRILPPFHSFFPRSFPFRLFFLLFT